MLLRLYNKRMAATHVQDARGLLRLTGSPGAGRGDMAEQEKPKRQQPHMRLFVRRAQHAQPSRQVRRPRGPAFRRESGCARLAGRARLSRPCARPGK